MDAKLSYREAAVRGATPVRLVVLLYEQAIEDLRRARVAFDQGEIETRTARINHAIVVIGHLQSSLDLEQGGDVARNLERFYIMLRAALVETQFRQSTFQLDQQISLLMQVHEAWCQVEPRNAAVPPVPQSNPAEAPAETDLPSIAGWNA
jgi:flagellar secretion chaperone FliS